MKILESRLRSIIKEESHRALRELWGKNLPGASEEDLTIASAIRAGDNNERDIQEAILEKAKSDFIEIFERKMIEKVRDTVKRNPDVSKFEDLSEDVKRTLSQEVMDSTISEYRETYTDTVLIREFVRRLEKKMGIRPIPPTLFEFVSRYAKDFVYQFVFGFIDNFVMVKAGDALDDVLKARYAAKGLKGNELELTVGAIGNTISDGVGDIGAGYVESMLDDPEGLVTKILDEAATDRQIEIAPAFAQAIMKSSTLTGVMAGCIVGWKVGLLAVRLAAAVPAIGAISLHPVTIVVSLLVAGALGLQYAALRNQLSEHGKSAVDNATSRFIAGLLKIRNSDVYPQDRIMFHDYAPEGKEQEGAELFKQDIENNRDEAQKIWNREMDVDRLASHQDLIDVKSELRTAIADASLSLGLADPNITQLDESRLQRLAGLI